MGSEISQEQIDPAVSPRTLDSRDLDGVAKFIRQGRAKRIVVLTGAGISTSAGIPDFRSPETGLYANLARLDLPYAEAVFDISYFREKPEPFYVLAKELYPGQFFPTPSHSFLQILNTKNLLHQLFTQNIDCLERKAGIPAEKIVEAHGSFATQRCIECKTRFPDDLMKEMVDHGNVPHCSVPECNGLVKPDIVFFGEALPAEFREKAPLVASADLVIIMGTSLSVAPFSTLPQFAQEGVPRVLFNKERVGDIGSRLDDVIVLGECDDGVRQLADALGWRDELEAAWRAAGGRAKEEDAESLQAVRLTMSKDELLEAEIAKLTGEVVSTLKLSENHIERVNQVVEMPTNNLGTDDSEKVAEAAKNFNRAEVLGTDISIPMKQTQDSNAARRPSIRNGAELDMSLPQNRSDT